MAESPGQALWPRSPAEREPILPSRPLTRKGATRRPSRATRQHSGAAYHSQASGEPSLWSERRSLTSDQTALWSGMPYAGERRAVPPAGRRALTEGGGAPLGRGTVPLNKGRRAEGRSPTARRHERKPQGHQAFALCSALVLLFLKNSPISVAATLRPDTRSALALVAA